MQKLPKLQISDIESRSGRNFQHLCIILQPNIIKNNLQYIMKQKSKQQRYVDQLNLSKKYQKIATDHFTSHMKFVNTCIPDTYNIKIERKKVIQDLIPQSQIIKRILEYQDKINNYKQQVISNYAKFISY